MRHALFSASSHFTSSRSCCSLRSRWRWSPCTSSRCAARRPSLGVSVPTRTHRRQERHRRLPEHPGRPRRWRHQPERLRRPGGHRHLQPHPRRPEGHPRLPRRARRPRPRPERRRHQLRRPEDHPPSPFRVEMPHTQRISHQAHLLAEVLQPCRPHRQPRPVEMPQRSQVEQTSSGRREGDLWALPKSTGCEPKRNSPKRRLSPQPDLVPEALRPCPPHRRPFRRRPQRRL